MKRKRKKKNQMKSSFKHSLCLGKCDTRRNDNPLNLCMIMHATNSVLYFPHFNWTWNRIDFSGNNKWPFWASILKLRISLKCDIFFVFFFVPNKLKIHANSLEAFSMFPNNCDSLQLFKYYNLFCLQFLPFVLLKSPSKKGILSFQQ